MSTDDRKLIEDFLPIQAISAETSREKSVRFTTNQWHKAQQLAETCWLYVAWDPSAESSELVRIHNPVAKLDHAKREIVAARFFQIPAEPIMQL